MAQNLTARAVANIQPNRSKRVEIPDLLVPGLYLVVQPTGRKGWAVRYRHAGKPTKLTLGSYPILGLAEARQKARAALEVVASGANPAQVTGEEGKVRDTVAEIAQQFLKRHAGEHRTLPEMTRIFDREILPAWGQRGLAEITRRDVIDLVDGIVDRGSPIMANRVLARVQKFMAWAVARDIIAASPAAGIPRPSPEKSRDRILTDDEMRWFWAGCERLGWPFGPLFRLLLLTAQRRDEVGEMTWREIAGTIWTIPAARSKNKRAHAVPLAPVSVAILDALPRIGGAPGYVFTTTGEKPASGYSKAKDRLDRMMLAMAREDAQQAGSDPDAVSIPHWTLHDLRRTAASGMARAGVQLPVIERVLNHVSGSFAGIVGVYQRHSFAGKMSQALDLWGHEIARISGERRDR